MKGYDTDTVVYVMSFDARVTTDRELRVFVRERRVTAMSQYDCLKMSTVFGPMDDRQLAKVARDVDTFHQDHVAERWQAVQGTPSYVMDVEYIADASSAPCVRLIELNCFGAELAAGSALFHWLRDEDEMHSPSRLCVRVWSG
mmetsp:Transcript_177450/g.562963  ORF Transcript_177450/g.562963 Transcript_177450/m.562963 type:complete len:143 (-) Transcript_177450:67-495(-)